jgi:hypothetical protein
MTVWPLCSQNVIIDSTTARKILIDLAELDGHRAKEPLYRATIEDLKRAVSLQDSIIRNNALQLDLKDDIVRLEAKKPSFWQTLKEVGLFVVGFILGLVL